MRAAVLREFGGIPTVEEVATPVPGRGEVRLRVRACGVDRFDVEIAAGKRPGVTLPLILGHEIAGEVSAVGPEVAGWSEGHRVVSSLYLVCGECDLCRSGRETICRDFRGHVGVAVPGGYAEEVVVPSRRSHGISAPKCWPSTSPSLGWRRRETMAPWSRTGRTTDRCGTESWSGPMVVEPMRS